MSMERKAKNQGSTFLWLKFLVLISFLCFAGLFDHPKLDTKEHDHHKTRDKYQYWKESKIGWTSNSKNKMTNWGSLHPPSPIPHPPLHTPCLHQTLLKNYRRTLLQQTVLKNYQLWKETKNGFFSNYHHTSHSQKVFLALAKSSILYYTIF